MAKNLYKTLGVSRDASAAEIKRAYRKLAKKYHPDSSGDDQQTADRFKEVSAAFDVLKDPERRKLFDEFGEASLRTGFDAKQARAYKQWTQHAAGPGSGWPTGGSDIFGRGRRGPRSRGGFVEDLYSEIFAGGGGPMEKSLHSSHVLEIDLETALGGGNMTLSLDLEETCTNCNGRGVLGRATRTRCMQCHGHGSRKRRDQLTVEVPAKTPDGSKLKVKGRGRVGSANRRGDLVLEIRIRPHPVFVREGKDLLVDLPITVGEAILGSKITLRTPDDRTLTVAVPPGSQSGQNLRLKGQGLGTGKRAGSLIARLMIRVPKHGGTEAAEQLREAYGDEVKTAPRD